MLTPLSPPPPSPPLTQQSSYINETAFIVHTCFECALKRHFSGRCDLFSDFRLPQPNQLNLFEYEPCDNLRKLLSSSECCKHKSKYSNSFNRQSFQVYTEFKNVAVDKKTRTGARIHRHTHTNDPHMVCIIIIVSNGDVYSDRY